MQTHTTLNRKPRDEIKARVERIVDEMKQVTTLLCKHNQTDATRLNETHDILQQFVDEMIYSLNDHMVCDRDDTIDAFDELHLSLSCALQELRAARDEAEYLDTSHDEPGPNPGHLSAEQLCDLRRGR